MDKTYEKSDPMKTKPSVESIVHQETAENQPRQLLTPQSLEDKYCFVDEIGHGAQGRIFKAVRLIDGKTVVIKQLNISSIKTWKEYELFHREAEVLSSLKIKGVAQFYDAIECLEDKPPCSYIVQEYIEGATLKKMLDDSHRFKVDDVYDILIQTLQILDKLHHHEPPVVHRDIKPSNLMISVDKDGHYRVTVIDFGAVSNPQVQGGGSTVAGTYGYMPPEQLMGKPEPASDIYALAAVVVQLFCGKSPADIPTKGFRLVFEPEMQDKPHALVTTLRQMLEPKVENRLVDIPEIIKRFTDYKANKFDGEDNVNRHVLADEDSLYGQRIEKLRYICESNGFEIWQDLPDKVPRSIPKPYYEKVFRNNVLEDNNNVEKSLKTKYTFNFGWFLVFLISILIMVVGVILIVYEASWLSGIFICFVGGFLAYTIIGGGMITTDLNTLYTTFSHQVGISFHELGSKLSDNDVNMHYEQLMKNGRKGIGIITKIEFLPCLKANVEVLKNSMLVCHEYPSFKVQYKFNPPDDRRSEDIFHEFITHAEPENHYSVGEPLPILYQIEDKYFFDEVYSMPYPVPLDDMSHLTYLVDMSSSIGGEELNQDKVGIDFIDMQLPPSVFYFINENNYLSALSMLSYHVNEGYSYESAVAVIFRMWESERSEIQTRCVDCLFDIAFPHEKQIIIDRHKPLQIVSKLLSRRPIPEGILSILNEIQTKMSCSSYISKVEAYDSHDFDGIWASMIELFVDPELDFQFDHVHVSEIRLKIIDGFRYWANVESAFKLYQHFDDVVFENKNSVVDKFKSWYRFKFD